MHVVNVLSAGAVRLGVTGIALAFGRKSGNRIALQFTSAPKVRARVLAGEAVDVVIASSSALDALARESKIIPVTRVIVGRSSMAVVARQGVPLPDISTTAAFKAALLNADIVTYNEGSSGGHAAEIVEKLGLAGQISSKVRVAPTGAAMMELITTYPGQVLGLAQVTNIRDHIGNNAPVALAGLFPDEIQRATTYEIAVASSADDSDIAAALVREFATNEAKQILASAGVEPVVA